MVAFKTQNLYDFQYVPRPMNGMFRVYILYGKNFDYAKIQNKV